MTNRNGCLICGQDLKYSEDYHKYSCYYCQQRISANATCVNNHFVCDQCHSMSGTELIETFCNNSLSFNPVEMANEIMESEKIKMHGPEHHFLVPAVLISAYCNLVNDPGKKTKIGIAKKRYIFPLSKRSVLRKKSLMWTSNGQK